MNSLNTHRGSAKNGVGTKKGIFMSLSIFLMFSALLLLAYNISVANTRNNEAFTARAAMDRMNTQFDGVMYSLSQLPNASLNYSANGASFVFLATVPATFMNSSSGDFLTFNAFMANFSYTNTSVNISDSLPGSISIYPQNMTVNQTSNTSFSFQPQDNNSGKSVSNYTIDMVIDSTPAPTIAWNPLNSVLASSSDALYVSATARVIGGASTSVGAYINRTLLNKLEFKWDDDLVLNTTFNGTSLIGGLTVSAKTVATPQMLINANFSANDNNWTKTAGTGATIAWYNSGQTGGSENVTVAGGSQNSYNYVLQDVTTTHTPTSGTMRWCYQVTHWNPGSTGSGWLAVYIRSPGGTGNGTLMDNVSITGTTAWLCRSNSSIPAAILNDSGTYQFTALPHLQTSGGSRYISVLLDDFQLNFTLPVTMNVTVTMNSTSPIDWTSGGTVPANISVAVGNEFKRVSTNG